MRRRQSFVTVLIGKSVLIREGIAGILSAANFRTLASVSCADDLPLGKFQSQHVLVLIVHTGDDIDFVVEQIEFLRSVIQRPALRSWPTTIGWTRWWRHFVQVRMATSSMS